MAEYCLRVVSPGLLSTLQDLGRPGYRRYGIPESGALDPFSMRAANCLVRNPEKAPTIEVLGGNLVLEFEESIEVAVAGAPAEVVVDGEVKRVPTAMTVPKASRLSLGTPESGFVDYVSIRGGIDGEFVLGSYSTYMLGGFGGSWGRRLEAGDRLRALRLVEVEGNVPVPYVFETTHQVHEGPHTTLLDRDELSGFLSNGFTVSEDSNRSGYRLRPDGLNPGGSTATLTSLPVFPGMLQLLPSGELVLLLNDSQTVGGYPVIGLLDRTALAGAVQAGPGGKLNFVLSEE